MPSLDSLMSRRQLLRAGAVSTTVSMSGWMGKLALAAEANKTRPKRSCILLWMNGGPSTIDLWDLKPGNKNGGPYKEIATAAPGVKISEHLPKLAKHMMRTGRAPGGPIQYPSLGALVSKELAHRDAELPGFVSIAPARFLSAA